MKLTRHNGRSGKNGTYNPKHNDRQFDVANSEHIDEDRTANNLYWDFYNGYRFADSKKPDEDATSFEKAENLFYSVRYGEFVKAQNARNEKNRHTERNRTTTDLLKDKRTCPEESIYQIGNVDDHVDPELLFQVVTDFFNELEKRFGTHVHILDWALHLDEATPHIQERHVFDCKNSYGEICPQQEKALEELGFELPDPSKKQGRHNNRKMTFDSACRAMLFDIARNYGLNLEQEPEYGGRAYLEKQDFILAKQKEQIEAKEQRLEELTLKIEDVETLIDDVTDIAYDKAVEVVTNTVKTETHEEDIRLIEGTKRWIQSPECKAPKKQRDFALFRLDGVITKIKNAMQTALQNTQRKMLSPEVKRSGTVQIKEKAKESVLAKLAKKQERIKREEEVNRNEHSSDKKQNIEI
ncbi:MAG: plasmid recombination protein [Ruminococcus sp.]|nr:plasmid recombination protein [Ruminococcus sp.]